MPLYYKRREGILLPLVAIFILAIFIVGIYSLLNFKKKTKLLTPNSQTVVQNQAKTTITPKQNFFINYVPHFDKLTLDDLPNPKDVRSILNYKNHQIIVAYNKIIEFDPASNSILRMNNLDYYHSINWVAIYSSYLYISVSRDSNEFNGRKILKVNLDDGSVVKEMNLKNEMNINLSLISYQNNIWVSSEDGIYKINPSDDSFISWTPQDLIEANPILKASPKSSINNNKTATPNSNNLGELGSTNIPLSMYNAPDKCLGYIYVVNNKLIVHTCTYDYFVYDNANNKWDYIINSTTKTFGTYQQDNFKFDIPTYYEISNLVNGKYYLWADKGLFTLKKGGFPAKLSSLNLGFWVVDMNEVPVQTAPMVGGKFFVTSDENWALSVGSGSCYAYGGLRPGCTHILVRLVNLKTEDNYKFTDSPGALSEQEANKFNNSTIREKSGQLLITDQTGNQVLATLDLANKTLNFNR